MFLTVDVLGLKVDVFVVDVLKVDVLKVVQMARHDKIHQLYLLNISFLLIVNLFLLISLFLISLHFDPFKVSFLKMTCEIFFGLIKQQLQQISTK